jgi:endonuclease/exonuclease/phosphatase (EEP) superfamily protein YafD
LGSSLLNSISQHRFVSGCIFLVSLSLALAGLTALVAQRDRVADSIVQVSGPLIIIAFVALVGAALVRSPGGIIAALAAVAILSALALPAWLPNRGSPAISAPVLTIYSANLHSGNDDYLAVQRSIERANPDLVVLVEVSPGIVENLGSVLRGYPHRQVTPNMLHGGLAGTVIASRYPMALTWPAVKGMRSTLVTCVDGPVGPVNIVAVHLTRPWPYLADGLQLAQAKALVDLIETLPGKTIVAGDFNSVSNGQIGRLIQEKAGLRPSSGWQGTWPTNLPPLLSITIDQVFRPDSLALVGRRVGQRNGSDHRPVITQLTIAR